MASTPTVFCSFIVLAVLVNLAAASTVTVCDQTVDVSESFL